MSSCPSGPSAQLLVLRRLVVLQPCRRRSFRRVVRRYRLVPAAHLPAAFATFWHYQRRARFGLTVHLSQQGIDIILSQWPIGGVWAGLFLSGGRFGLRLRQGFFPPLGMAGIDVDRLANRASISSWVIARGSSAIVVPHSRARSSLLTRFGLLDWACWLGHLLDIAVKQIGRWALLSCRLRGGLAPTTARCGRARNQHKPRFQVLLPG